MISIDPAIILAAQAAQKATGVLASISLAQYGLESGWGKFITGAFNYFGVKAIPGQVSALCATHEFINGKYISVMARFACYASPQDAFLAHAQLLANHPQYAKFMQENNVHSVQDACNALTGVYATAPNYGPTLYHIIVTENLTQYDGL